MVRVDVLAAFMDKASGTTAKQSMRGAPTKKERLEAERMGLSVKEYRAQQAIELGEGGRF